MSCLTTEVVCCFGSCAASLLGSLVSSALSHAARLGHLLIGVATFSVAMFIGSNYANQIKRINDYSSLTNVRVNLTSDCDADYVDNCIYQQLIYRASLSLVLLYGTLAVVTRYVEYVDRNLWLLKLVVSMGLFVSFCLLDNAWFTVWAETSRIASIAWLLVQGLLFLDFGHDVHDMLTSGDEDMSITSKVAYLVTSAGALALNIVGLIYLIHHYTNNCELNMGFVVVTLCFGLMTTVLSLMECVGRGALTPLLMTSYALFMCWYAVQSNPDAAACNPDAASIHSEATSSSLMIVCVVSVGTLTYCVVHGSNILNAFHPQVIIQLRCYKESYVTYDGMFSLQGNGVTSSYSAVRANSTVELRKVLTGCDDDDAAGADNDEEEEPVANRGSATDRVLFHVVLASVRMTAFLSLH